MKIGTITFGKSRPAPKQVLVDVTMDDKTNRELYKIGLKLLKIDKDLWWRMSLLKHCNTWPRNETSRSHYVVWHRVGQGSVAHPTAH
jgi:hypothetical protein